MRALALSSVVVVVAAPSTARAEDDGDENMVDSMEESRPTWSIGVDLGALSPYTDGWKELAALGIGGFVHFDWLLGRFASLSVRAGFFNHFSRRADDGLDRKTTEAPLLFGLELQPIVRPFRLILAAEGGPALFARKTRDPETFDRTTDWTAELAAALSLAVRKDWFELRGGVYAPSVTGREQRLAILVTVGFLADF